MFLKRLKTNNNTPCLLPFLSSWTFSFPHFLPSTTPTSTSSSRPPPAGCLPPPSLLSGVERGPCCLLGRGREGDWLRTVQISQGTESVSPSLSPSSPLLLLHTTHTHTRTRTHTHTHANTQNSDRPQRGCSNPCKRRASALPSALSSPGCGSAPEAALSPGVPRARFGRVFPRIKRGGRVQTDQKTRRPHTPRLQLWLGVRGETAPAAPYAGEVRAAAGEEPTCRPAIGRRQEWGPSWSCSGSVRAPGALAPASWVSTLGSASGGTSEAPGPRLGGTSPPPPRTQQRSGPRDGRGARAAPSVAELLVCEPGAGTETQAALPGAPRGCAGRPRGRWRPRIPAAAPRPAVGAHAAALRQVQRRRSGGGADARELGAGLAVFAPPAAARGQHGSQLSSRSRR